VPVDGSRSTGALYSTKTYVLTVSGPGGSAQCQETIGVIPNEIPTPSCSMWADDTTLAYGEGTSLRWDSNNATSASLTQFGVVEMDGSRWTGALYASKTYVLTVSGARGSAQCSVTVTVSHIPPPPPPPHYEVPSCWIRVTNYGGYVGYNHYQNQMTLTWGSNNATSAFISPNIGSVSTYGSRSVYGNVGTYTMTVWGPGGSATCQTQAYFVPPPPYIPPTIPHISLTQIPHTGFGDAFSGAMYWLSITLVTALGAATVAYYRPGMFSIAGTSRMFRGRTRMNSRPAEFIPDTSLGFTPIRFLER
jgi:hypothetical protein